MTYASTVILEVSEDLNDQASGDTYARWSQADLLKYLNAGERLIVFFKPTSYVVTKTYQLVEGAAQNLPDGSSSYQDPSSNDLPKAIELVRILRNMGGDGLTQGSNIYPVRPQDMEELLPGRHYTVPELILNENPDDSDILWSKAACTLSSDGGIIGTAVDTIHYIYQDVKYFSENGNLFKISVKAKAGNQDHLYLSLAQFDANDVSIGSTVIYFDLSGSLVGTAIGSDTPYPEGRVVSTDGDGYVHCEAIFTVIGYNNKTSYVQCVVMAAEGDSDNTFTGDGSTVDVYVKNISFTNESILNYSYDPKDRTSFEVYPAVPAFGEFWIQAQYSAIPPVIEATYDPGTQTYDYVVDINIGDEYLEPLKNYMKYRAHGKDASSSMYAKQESVAYWNLFLAQIGRKDLIEKQYRGNYADRDK